MFQCRNRFEEISLEYDEENASIAMFMVSISKEVIRIDFPNICDNWGIKCYHICPKIVNNYSQKSYLIGV